MGGNWGTILRIPRRHDRIEPTATNAVACGKMVDVRSGRDVNLIRDEEVVGSNPATPTEFSQFRAGLPAKIPALNSFKMIS
jgi:hypothetical protein